MPQKIESDRGVNRYGKHYMADNNGAGIVAFIVFIGQNIRVQYCKILID